MNSRHIIFSLGLFIIGIVVGAGGLAAGYLWATGDSGTASEAITAPETDLIPDISGLQQFQIIPEESEVRFILDELDPPVQGLVGRTDQVAGNIWLDFEDPRNSVLGPIRINMRTVATGHRARDTAIRERILLTARDEYEFSDFTPIGVYGLPETIEMGQTIEFSVLGEMPIVDTTHTLLFEVTATLDSEDRISGIGSTTVYRDELGLLQSFLGERGVSNAMQLEIEFIAERIREE